MGHEPSDTDSTIALDSRADDAFRADASLLSTPVESPRIARLSDSLINQIAAGEVVERPASVVKELVENSLDAGSTRVDILLTDGGMREIQILDDGIGMAREDLVLCVERHATSKLHSAADLEQISTFGFRGEALSSIASVSELEIRTRTAQSPGALAIVLAQGLIQGEPRPTAGPAGTSIWVRDLFSQVPARKKFLKSVPTEFSHCARVVREVALGNPGVRFFLHHQGQLVREYIGATRAARFAEGFSKEWEPLVIQESAEGSSLEAYLSPTHLIQSRGELFLYINDRGIRNRLLLSAVRSAYLDTLGPHHEPSGVVYLDVRPDWVDVNVHPQKLEVRCFRQETWYPWISQAIRKAISGSRATREIISEPPASYRVLDSPRSLESLSQERPASESPRSRPPLTTVPTVPTVMPLPEMGSSPVHYLGQVKAAYLVCEDDEGVILVDQHALHEKQRFEELVESFERGRLPIQSLLVPRIFRPPTDLLPILETHRPALTKFGFDVEPFGDGDVAIKSRPQILGEEKVEKVLLELLESLRDTDDTEFEALKRAARPALATLACHSVVRAGQSLSAREAEALLSGISRLEQGWTCPHGRPVMLRLSYHSIEKHFERK